MQHQKFCYKSLDDIRARAVEVGAWLPLSDDISVLSTPIDINGRRLPNRFALQPMEGTDGTEDGRPGELTIRRYHRFAKGGAALIHPMEPHRTRTLQSGENRYLVLKFTPEAL